MKLPIAILMTSLIWPAISQAVCAYVPTIETAITIDSCETIEPGRLAEIGAIPWVIAGTSPEAPLGDSYAGALVTTGTNKYFLRDSTLSACSAFDPGDRLDVRVTTHCCDRTQAPCLLGTSKVIEMLEQ